MNKSIKLHLACVKDSMRPVMEHIKVTKDVCVATDAHIMAIIPTNHIFNDDFILDIPDEGFLIHMEDYKKMIQHKVATWKTKGQVIKMVDSKKRPLLIEVVEESDFGRYPNWKSVLPWENQCKDEAKFKIGLNAKLLHNLQESMGIDSCQMTFYEGSKPIQIEPSAKETSAEGRVGIIMPVLNY